MQTRIAERLAKHHDQMGLLGITIPELEALVGYIDQQAGSDGLLQGWLGKDKKPLHKDYITINDVLNVLKSQTQVQDEPAFSFSKRSHEDLVASGCTFRGVAGCPSAVASGTNSKQPKLFRSHWWDEPVKGFLKALKEHTKVHEAQLFGRGHIAGIDVVS